MTAIASSRLPVARAAYGVVGVGAAVAAAFVASPWVLALWLVPDVALLYGMSSEFTGDGRLAPRAVPFYNAVHSLFGPLAVVGLGAVFGGLVLALGLVWLSHCLVDRASGYGLRTADGWQRG
jgi:hypothetical protein